MSKKTTLIVCLVLFSSFAASLTYQLWREGNVSNDSSLTPDSSLVVPLPVIVTKQGTLSCLEHAKTIGPQTLECAIGLKQDDGTTYAIKDSDGTSSPSTFTGMKLEVTGILTQPDTPYKSAGTISVQTFRKL